MPLNDGMVLHAITIAVTSIPQTRGSNEGTRDLSYAGSVDIKHKRISQSSSKVFFEQQYEPSLLYVQKILCVLPPIFAETVGLQLRQELMCVCL